MRARNKAKISNTQNQIECINMRIKVNEVNKSQRGAKNYNVCETSNTKLSATYF